METFQSCKVLLSRGLEKDGVWVVDKEERTYIPLQAQELQLGSGDFFHTAQASLRERLHTAREPRLRLSVSEAGAASPEPPSG